MDTLEMIRKKEVLQLPDIQVPMYVLDFLENMKEKGRAYGTYVRYGYYIEEFLQWMNRQKKTPITFEMWKGLSKEDYDAYYENLYRQRDYSLDSLKRVESVLTQMYLYYIEKGHTEMVSPALTLEQTQLLKNQFSEKDFVSEKDFEKLLEVMKSYEGLTENQLKGRDLLINRNICIVNLFYKYGLTMKELVSLTMEDVQLGRYKQIEVKGKTGKRHIPLEDEDGILLVQYLKDIPEPVRPKHHSTDPLFVAFDYQRLTYRWVYDNEDRIDNGQPKELSRLAIQKMILQEVKRAGLLSKGISSQTMRNTAILQALKQEESEKEIMDFFGLKTPITLRRYKEYLHKNI